MIDRYRCRSRNTWNYHDPWQPIPNHSFEECPMAQCWFKTSPMERMEELQAPFKPQILGFRGKFMVGWQFVDHPT